jgi:hypothetical protein
MKLNPLYYALFFLGAGMLIADAQAMTSDPLEDNDGSLSSEKPHIPEPMVFDLVRPLGAEKGELEMNTLVQYSPHGVVEWAPEIEFAPRDGLAFELEFPFENTTFQEYKIAAQGTFGVFRKHFIHGWQAIGRYDKHEASYSGDLLYLNGYSSPSHWSVFNMAGIRIGDEDKKIKPTGLMNTSLFYVMSERFTAGVEWDNEFNSSKRWGYMVAPQLHVDLNRNLSIQLGAGYSALTRNGKEWLGITRVIVAF